MLQRIRFARPAGLAAIAATVLVAGCTSAAQPTPTQAPAASSAMPKVTIMVGGLNKQIYLSAMLTQQLGYWKDEGVDVSLVDEPSGQSAEDALLAGEVQFAFGSYDHTISLQGLKKNVVDVFQALIAPGEAEMVATKAADTLTSPADFKDKNLGVTSIGSGTHTLRQFLAVKNKATVQKVVNGLVKTHTFIASHTPEEIAAKMPEDYYAGDKDLYLTALKGQMPMYSSDGRMPKGGPEFVLSVLQQFDENVKDKQIDLSKTYTAEFVDAAK